MTTIGKKLKSNRGVSLIIALLFFLLAFMVTAVILTATAANTNRIEKIREEKQTYMATLSVANMLKDTLDASKIKMRVLDLSYRHECGEKDGEGKHKVDDLNEIELVEPYYESLYDKEVYENSDQIVFLVKKVITEKETEDGEKTEKISEEAYQYNNETNSFDVEEGDTDFNIIEEIIAKMAYQVASTGEEDIEYIGCDTSDIFPESYKTSIEVKMTRNFDLSFTVGTVCGDTSYYMTLKTRTISTVPTFLRDEFTEMHGDMKYSVFFDSIMVDYDWDIIAYVKGSNT